jgi:hypothetical protein
MLSKLLLFWRCGVRGRVVWSLIPMKPIMFVRGLLFAGAFALTLTARAQIIELRATINAAQETPVSTSAATGSAVMFYNVAANTFDLVVTINNLANTATLSHIHEGAVGVAGSVVTDLGGEGVYTRTGNTLSGTFLAKIYGGTKLTLLQGGAYFNLHSAAFPGGEVRGQLIAQPKRLVANMTVAQEQAAFPAVNLSALNDFGAAVMLYNPTTNTVSLRISLYHFNNTLNNSHFHNGAPAVSGPVAVNLGNSVNTTFANGGRYSNADAHISGAFDIPFTGTVADPVLLLTGGTYLNFHSTTFAGGELRGQVRASDEIPSTRMSNLSVRGFVGTGEQQLIQGITVNGPDPVRVLMTAKGPSLSAFGITGPLANPRLTVYDSAGRQIALNDDMGTASGDLAGLVGVPTNSVESAMLLVLPPGNYTVIVSSSTGATGVALLEVTDLRNGGLNRTASSIEETLSMQLQRARNGKDLKPSLELCVTPLPLATVTK